MAPLLTDTESLTELETLVRQGMAGDQRVLPALRTLLDSRPDLWQDLHTLADRVRQAWLQRLTGSDVVAQEILTRQLQSPTLATCENVVVKLGGMLNRLAAYDYRALPAPVSSTELAGYWRPYMEACIERFGAHRCMFESNFPVEKMGVGWVTLWNAFKRIAAGASAAEKLALFSGTARRVYRLN
jgi:Amidohydrolase